MNQDEYLAILFADCGFNGAQRRDFLALRFDGRRYTDELTTAEKQALIDDLKERKARPAAVYCEACGTTFTTQGKLDQHESECIG